MSDNRLLAPVGYCDYMKDEKHYPNILSKIYFFNVELYLDNWGYTRIVKLEGGKAVAGAIFNSAGVIMQMYTLPEYRRMGYMKGLLTVWQHVLCREVYLDDNFTEDGEGFLRSVGLLCD